jgi:hypothetical protein
MTQWIATLHGDTEGLGDEAEAAESAVRDALQSVAEGLADAGHTGIAATFHSAFGGDTNLLAPGETPDAGAAVGTAPESVADLGAGEVDPGAVAEAAGVPEGTPVPLAEGQALAPEIPDKAAQAGTDAQQPPAGTPAPQ